MSEARAQAKAALALVRLHIEIKKRQARALSALQAGYESLMQYIPRVTPKFSPPNHLKPVVDVLEQVESREVRVIYMVPPRNGKTETVLHFIARYIERNPGKTAAYCTYAQRFANTSARKIHRMLKDNGVKPGDVQTVSEWRTREGGGLLATGIGGPLTGYGVDLLVIDDALKNRQDADSPLIRNRQWEWFEDVAETRLEPGASVIILMTRWHEDDLPGRAIANRPGEYEVIRIPAIADGLDALGKAAAPDPLGRNVGEAIWPERRGGLEAARLFFEKIKAAKPATFDSLYQGLPRSKDEQLFPDATFYTSLPPGLRYSAGTDFAYSEKTRANFTAFVVIAWDFEPGINAETGEPEMIAIGYIVYAEKWRKELPATRDKLFTLQQRYPVPFGAEANGPQKGAVDIIRKGDAGGNKKVRLVPLLPLTDKYAKWQGLSELWKAGRLRLPLPTHDRGLDEPRPEVQHGLDTRWLEMFLEEMNGATGVNDPFDDLVDATYNAYALRPPAPPMEEKPTANPRRFERDRESRSGRRM